MLEGFAYVAKDGILLEKDYRLYNHRKNKCQFNSKMTRERSHLADIGFIEHDGRTNDELKELLQTQPISIGMYSTGTLNLYRSGIITEDFLRCSHPRNEVNHGVLLVGYGSVGDNSVKGNTDDQVRNGKCQDYWIIRNSWGPNWGEDGFFKLCADGVGSKQTPLGTCLVNKYAVWPTRDMNDIDPDF